VGIEEFICVHSRTGKIRLSVQCEPIWRQKQIIGLVTVDTKKVLMDISATMVKEHKIIFCKIEDFIMLLKWLTRCIVV